MIEDSVLDQLRTTLGESGTREQLNVSEPLWQSFEQDPGALVRALVKSVSYDGTTGAVSLNLARNETIMKLHFTVPFRRVLAPRIISIAPPTEPQGRAPRIARLLALAHKQTRWFVPARSPTTPNWRAWVTFRQRASVKSWFCCIWPLRSRNTFSFFHRPTPDSSPNGDCARSRVSRAGTGSANYSSSFFRIDLLRRPLGVINVITRRLPPKETR
jgi:hypothetical protein